jgi:hypothetical protein
MRTLQRVRAAKAGRLERQPSPKGLPEGAATRWGRGILQLFHYYLGKAMCGTYIIPSSEQRSHQMTTQKIKHLIPNPIQILALCIVLLSFSTVWGAQKAGLSISRDKDGTLIVKDSLTIKAYRHNDTMWVTWGHISKDMWQNGVIVWGQEQNGTWKKLHTNPIKPAYDTTHSNDLISESFFQSKVKEYLDMFKIDTDLMKEFPTLIDQPDWLQFAAMYPSLSQKMGLISMAQAGYAGEVLDAQKYKAIGFSRAKHKGKKPECVGSIIPVYQDIKIVDAPAIDSSKSYLPLRWTVQTHKDNDGQALFMALAEERNDEWIPDPYKRATCKALETPGLYECSIPQPDYSDGTLQNYAIMPTILGIWYSNENMVTYKKQ